MILVIRLSRSGVAYSLLVTGTLNETFYLVYFLHPQDLFFKLPAFNIHQNHGDEPYRILVVQTGVYSCISDSIRDAYGFYL